MVAQQNSKSLDGNLRRVVASPFLTARWESLVLRNYSCPPELLKPLVPKGTELDPWDGSHLVSLVGFRFVDTRLKGLGVPGHRTFEEVNLRFYVRREMPDGTTRRAVVFIRELVPRIAIATVARVVYNEPYRSVPMDHFVQLDETTGGSASYSWVYRGHAYSLRASVKGAAEPLVAGSQAEFVTEHYWGYTRQRDGGTIEYQVEHPPWHLWATAESEYQSPSSDSLYGPAFSEVLRGAPCSSMVAVGSPVTVFSGTSVAV